MKYDVRLSDEADSDIDDCFFYMAGYSLEFAKEKMAEITALIYDKLPYQPYFWSFFFVTGAPYRAALYRVGKRTSYWLVYQVNEQNKLIRVVRFWNASQDPNSFKI